MNKRAILSAIFLAAGIGMLPYAAAAYLLKTDQSVVIPETPSIVDTLYTAGQTVTIDADVDGDVVCAGQSVIINGDVNGSVLCAGQSVTVNGNVSGSVRVAGNNLLIGGDVGQNVMAFGATVQQAKDKKVAWDMLIGAGSVTILGNIGRDLHGGAGQVTIGGQVGQDVNLTLSPEEGKTSSLHILEGASVGGSVKYQAEADARIEPGATIRGEVNKVPPKFEKQEKKFAKKAFGGIILFEIMSLVGALVVAVVAIFLWKDTLKEITDGMIRQASNSLGWGLVLTLLLPVLAVVIFFTIIGIPLGIIMLVLWLMALYLAKILTAILIGRMVVNKKGVEQEKSLYLAALVGIIISWIIFAIPFLGGLFFFLAIIWGMGGVWMFLKKEKMTAQA